MAAKKSAGGRAAAKGKAKSKARARPRPAGSATPSRRSPGSSSGTGSAVEAEERRALLIAGDATDPGFCRDAVERTVRELGGLDILVNNAAFQEHLPEGGSILNTGSVTGIEDSKALLDYSATKGALHAFTKSLAQSLVERGIRVNCVAPVS